MITGPTVMKIRGPIRADSCPAGVERNVRNRAIGRPTAPAASGEYPSVPCQNSPSNANETYRAP